MAKSAKRGKNTSKVEVLNISSHGVWVCVADREYFLSYELCPWFQEATLKEIQEVELQHGVHLHWPSLDVDLELDSLDYPAEYPLVYRS